MGRSAELYEQHQSKLIDHDYIRRQSKQVDIDARIGFTRKMELRSKREFKGMLNGGAGWGIYVELVFASDWDGATVSLVEPRAVADRFETGKLYPVEVGVVP